MTQVHRLENANTDLFEYAVFDLVPTSNLQSDLLLTHRLCALDACMSEQGQVYRLKHKTFPVGATLHTITKQCSAEVDQGEEGIVVKHLFSAYEKGRSWRWTKLKQFTTLDLLVTGVEQGEGKYASTLGALLVQRLLPDGQSVTVKVGSGYTDEQRAEFWASPPRMIEVRYQNETKDGSLRFPTFVRVRDDK
jgi:ATP-dependent DNA ligase